jgi:hypothetical protein
MNSKLAWIEELLAGMRTGVRRFPLALAASLVAVIAFCVSIELDSNSDGNALRIALTAMLALPLFTASHLVAELKPTRRLPAHLVALLLVAGGFFITPGGRASDWTGAHHLTWWLAAAQAHLLVATLPLLARNRDWFWTFNHRLFNRFLLGALFSAILYAALAAALGSVIKLFGLEIEGERWAQLWIFIAIGVQSFFVLGGVPQLQAPAGEPEQRLPLWQERFARFLLTPVVLLYVAILLAYAIKIAIVREWPEGWVALPVLILAAAGGLVAVMLQPYVRPGGPAWARFFWRTFFPTLLLFAPLLFLAVGIRVSDYGYTPARYGGQAAALWLIVICGLFCMRRFWNVAWVPVSLIAFLFVATWGPLSAVAVSKRSQLHELRELATSIGVFENGVLRPAEPRKRIPEKDYQRLNDLLAHTATWHGRPALEQLLPQTGNRPEISEGLTSRWSLQNAIMTWLALDSIPDEESDRIGWSNRNLDFRGVFPDSAAISVARWNNSWGGFSTIELGEGRALRIPDDRDRIEVSTPNLTWQIHQPITDFLAGLHARDQPKLPLSQATLDFEIEGAPFRLIVLSSESMRQKGTTRFQNFDLLILALPPGNR